MDCAFRGFHGHCHLGIAPLARANRAAGGSLLTNEERLELFLAPSGISQLVRDDLAGLDQVTRRQADPRAERWRRITLLATAGALLILVLPSLLKPFIR
jgi:hypothetical protein